MAISALTIGYDDFRQNFVTSPSSQALNVYNRSVAVAGGSGTWEGDGAAKFIAYKGGAETGVYVESFENNNALKFVKLKTPRTAKNVDITMRWRLTTGRAESEVAIRGPGNVWLVYKFSDGSINIVFDLLNTNVVIESQLASFATNPIDGAVLVSRMVANTGRYMLYSDGNLEFNIDGIPGADPNLFLDCGMATRVLVGEVGANSPDILTFQVDRVPDPVVIKGICRGIVNL